MAPKGILTHVRGLVGSVVRGSRRVRDTVLRLSLARLFSEACRLISMDLVVGIVVGAVAMLGHFH